MSISAKAFSLENLGKSKFSHEISSVRELSEASWDYLGKRGYSRAVVVKWELKEVRVKRYEWVNWKKHLIFFDEPAIAFPATNGVLHCRLFQLPKSEGPWVTTPMGMGPQFFGDLNSNEVVLDEGEWDAMRLLDEGIPAVSSTCGAGTFNAEMARYFLGKRVWICFDRDRMGKRGAINAARFLKKTALEVRIVDLPLRGTATEKDLSDWFRKGGTNGEFRKLLADAVRYR